jgi:predicted acyl esterase
MMAADLYYERATEFLLSAEKVSDPNKREAMQELAYCWLRLAERADDYWRDASKHPPRRSSGVGLLHSHR